MSDEIMLVFGEDGVARKYDDAWDITIHCESEEEQKAVLEKLNNSNQEAKTQLSAEGTTSDLISRQDAIEVIEEMQMPIMRSMFPEEQFVFKGMSEALSAIKDLPSAHPEIEERKEESAQNVPKEDLISRKEAIDYCYQLINVEHQQGSDEMNYGQERVNQTEAILHHIEFMPSAQPEIVRCKDCKHHHYKKDIPYCDRIEYGYGWKDNDYCSRAERRTDEKKNI